MACTSISMKARAFWMAMAAKLAKSRTGSSSRSSKVRPPRRSMLSTPITLPRTCSGTTMEACGSGSVPGTSTPRGSLPASLTSCAWLWRTTQPVRPWSRGMR